MSDIDFNQLKNDFISSWSKSGVYHGKNIIKNLPGWEKIISILNNASRSKSILGDSLKSQAAFEVWYKDILAVKKVSYGEYNINVQPEIESEATMFFSVFFESNTGLERMGLVKLSEEIKKIENFLEIDTDITTIKISLSDKFVPWESHSWFTFILQLQGTNNWELRDKTTSFEENYFLEPGDVLLFKNDIEHQISNIKARSSLVGRFLFK